MDHFTHENKERHLDDDLSKIERKRRFSVSETIGRIYKDEPQQENIQHVKKLGDYIRFSNEGKPTRAEQLKRDRKLYEASGYSVIPNEQTNTSTHGEVIGTVNDISNSKGNKKGLEVSLVNGQIVLDRSSLNRQVDRFDMNDSDEEDMSDLMERSSGYRKHKVVVWSVEETKEFYECLRRFGTDFFMMNKVITNRTRRDLKNKFKTEEKRNPKLVNLCLEVHLKEKMVVPEVPTTTVTQETTETHETQHTPTDHLQEHDTTERLPEKESDEDVLTETSEEEEDSDDGLMIGDLL